MKFAHKACESFISSYPTPEYQNKRLGDSPHLNRLLGIDSIGSEVQTCIVKLCVDVLQTRAVILSCLRVGWPTKT